MNKNYSWAIGLLVVVVVVYLLSQVNIKDTDSILYSFFPKDTSHEFKEGVQY